MAPEPPDPQEESREPVPDYQQALSNLSNPELLSALDLALLELEKRLFRYAKVGPELLEMADEGLVLAARAKARLGQSLSAAQHTEGHLQVVGVGEWRPTSTRPSWNAEPRLPRERRSLSGYPSSEARCNGLIHRSAWKGNSPKSICTIRYSRGHMVPETPYSPGPTH
jgi:hypothetical protein